MTQLGWLAGALLALDFAARLGLAVRVIMRPRPVGAAWAWLTLVVAFPLVGGLLYLLLGELRLGNRRARWVAAIHEPYQRWLDELRLTRPVDWSAAAPHWRAMARLVESTAGIPALPGNQIELLSSADAVFDALLADIRAAQRTCHLEFYIWQAGGRADEVGQALLEAAARGVICRVLIDAVGGWDFFRGGWPARLRAGGVRVQAALPVGLFRMLFVRFDLRQHRKIVVIDGEIGYTGSINLVDPKFFKKDAGVGEWIDAMVRARGPAVEAMAVTFLEDWELETGESVEKLAHTSDVRSLPEQGSAAIQVIPSGPTIRADAMRGILLSAIYAARRELVLTTPYFVPDETLLLGLLSAARRGVEVTIVVPARVDSLLVRFASQAHKGELLQAGVRVALFHGGLLHTKSVTVDEEFSLFGTMNLDPRSLHLNFEFTLAAYDRDFTQRLRRLQGEYLGAAQYLSLENWRKRSPLLRFTENAARLLGPVL